MTVRVKTSDSLGLNHSIRCALSRGLIEARYNKLAKITNELLPLLKGKGLPQAPE